MLYGYVYMVYFTYYFFRFVTAARMASAASDLFTLDAPSNFTGVAGTHDFSKHETDYCEDKCCSTKQPSIFDVVKAGLVILSLVTIWQGSSCAPVMNRKVFSSSLNLVNFKQNSVCKKYFHLGFMSHEVIDVLERIV